MGGDIQLRIRKSVGGAGEAGNGGSDGRGQGRGIGELGTIENEDLKPSQLLLY